MPSKKATNFGEYFDLPNQKLRAYFGRVTHGSKDVVRTKFYDSVEPSTILADWMKHLDRVRDKWPTLGNFEDDLAKKVGPMSVMKPLRERLEDIDSYYDSILKDQTEIPNYAIDAVIEEFQAASGLRLRNQANTVKGMKKSTNSGSPYFDKRRNILEKSCPCHIAGDTIFSSGGAWKACAVLGWRGQEGGPKPTDVKQRVVWMFPFSLNILELQVYQPLIEACQKHNLVPAWISMEAVEERITRLFDTKDPDDLVVCTDFSKFDQHFNPCMQQAAKTILANLLTPSTDSKDWLEDVFPVKYRIPLAYNMGKIRFGLHGMASGSGGTNADETLTHRALQHEAAISAGATLNPNSMCLGDDGILTYSGASVEHITDVYSSHGQDMNLDKQYASTQDCTYLRRWYHKDYRVDGRCVGVYSTARALGRLMYQERFYDPKIWGPKMVALRQLSILENIKNHPLREEFVDYCMKGDRYRLGIDIPGFLNNIEREAQEATRVMPDFLGYVRSELQHEGISNWWIVQYLKSKA